MDIMHIYLAYFVIRKHCLLSCQPMFSLIQGVFWIRRGHEKYQPTVQLNTASSSSRLYLSSNVLKYTMVIVANGACYFKATSGISVPNCSP